MTRAIQSPGWRWTPRRKAGLAEALRRGVVTREAAKRELLMSDDEIESLLHRFERHGQEGLKQGLLQELRL